MVDKEENPAPMPVALKVALWLSAFWFIALILLVAGSGRCEGTFLPWKFWSPYLSCRPLNEVGDFLAGAFAPVAFMWLVATVFIQAQELGAQRRELELTRDVAGEQRDAMRSQAHWSESQASLLQQQADIANRKQVMAEVETDLSAFVFEVKSGILSDLHVDQGDGNPAHYSSLAEVVTDPELDESVRQIARHLRKICEDIEFDEVNPYSFEEAATWSRFVGAVINRRKELTAADQRRLDSLDLHQIERALTLWGPRKRSL